MDFSFRYFVMTIVVMAVVVICACFTLAGPWYAISEDWNTNSNVNIHRVSTFNLYRDIVMDWTYEDSATGDLLAKNTTKVSWDHSKLNEFARVFHLCGPLLIAAIMLDFVGIIIIMTNGFFSTTQRGYEEGCTAYCIFYRQRWIMLFCGLLGTSILMNTISSFLFMASPEALSHDIAGIEGKACSTGPCKSWSGHSPVGNRFRTWGPSFGWYVNHAHETIPLLYTSLFIIRPKTWILCSIRNKIVTSSLQTHFL
jgi:hypothetical protein